MIHYHGGPVTPNTVAHELWKRRHAMVSYARPDQIALAAEIAQSFTLDNGAFSIWKQGGRLSVPDYLAWVREWRTHPGFAWAVIPDVIEGSEQENDDLVALVTRLVPWSEEWVPVWHLHESLNRLALLVKHWPRVAFGSSGDYSEPGSPRWWQRMAEAMAVATDKDGRPLARLHGLRMMDPTIFSHIPFSSVDSTNVARNVSLDVKWKGTYQPLTEETRAIVLADRIEHHASAARWTGSMGVQKNLELVG